MGKMIAPPQKRTVGRPKGSGTKQLVSLRLDIDLVAAMKLTGAGWQTRANEGLRVLYFGNILKLKRVAEAQAKNAVTKRPRKAAQ